MRPAPEADGALRRQTIVTVSKPLSVEELGLDCIEWMGQRQRNSWRTLMTCCSAEFRTPPTTFYMNCCRTHTRMTTKYELMPRHHNYNITSYWDQRNFISRSYLKDMYPVLSYVRNSILSIPLLFLYANCCRISMYLC